MADLGPLELAVSSVEFPAMRRRVMDAVAALSDAEYQQRVWIEHTYPSPTFFDNFDEQVHTLFDDCDVLPDPEPTLGAILLPGDEVPRLRALGHVLGPMITDLGDVEDSIYLSDARWPAVMRAAGLALSAMVLAGGYVDP